MPCLVTGPDTVAARLSDEAVGRAKPLSLPLFVPADLDGAERAEASSLALPLSSPVGAPSSAGSSRLRKPKLVFGRLGGGTLSFSRACESVERALPRDVPPNISVLVVTPVELIVKDLGFPGVRFTGERGRGILDREGGGMDLDELVVEVVTAGLTPMKANNEVCLELLDVETRADDEAERFCRAGGLDREVLLAGWTLVKVEGAATDIDEVEGVDAGITVCHMLNSSRKAYRSIDRPPELLPFAPS